MSLLKVSFCLGPDANIVCLKLHSKLSERISLVFCVLLFTDSSRKFLASLSHVSSGTVITRNFMHSGVGFSDQVEMPLAILLGNK